MRERDRVGRYRSYQFEELFEELEDLKVTDARVYGGGGGISQKRSRTSKQK